ncbi:hypothetical protein JOB18_018344 [Solea senegalensis]|nr:hypothetical protein JOB18_018344 [Solea senegalensis]
MRELTKLRDELVKLNDEMEAQRANDNSAPTRSYIYVPRERQIQAFSGEGGTDGRSVEEFIEEVERVLRSREHTTEGQCDYILSLLRGPALEEVRLCMGGQSVGPSDLYSFLRNAFGEKRSITQLLQTFYNRKQAEGEDLRDYSHALSQILSSAVKQSANVIPNEKFVLRDQFIEGLRDSALRRELRKMVRDQPDCSLLDVRREALLWEMEESRPHRPRVVKSSQVKSEVSEFSESQFSATETNTGQSTALGDVQRAVAQQGKQLVELGKTLADLASAVTELSRRTTEMAFHEPKPRARPQPRVQPRFTPDGQPICFKCRGVGHIAKKCLQAKRGHDETTPGPYVVQENFHPRLP